MTIRISRAIALATSISAIALFSGCATGPSPKSNEKFLTESEIVERLDKLSGVDSVETSIQPSGFSRFAIITIYLKTDNVGVIAALQDYSAKLLFLNSTYLTPPTLIQQFRWASKFGPGAINQAPRTQVIQAIQSKKGVSVTANAPGTAVRLEVDTEAFDDGLNTDKIDVDDVPEVLKSPAPAPTSSPTPAPPTP